MPIRETAWGEQGNRIPETGKYRSVEIERFLFDPVYRQGRLCEFR